MNQGVILNRFRPNLGHFKNETILSEGLQRTIDLEQRAIADGGVPVDRNNTVNSIPYTLLKLNPSIVIGPDAYKDGKIHAIIPNDGSADLDVTRGSITTAFDKDSKVVRMPYNYLNNSIVSTWNQSASGFNLTPTTLLGMDALTVENISGASQSSSTSTNRVEGAQLSLPIEIGETYTYSFIIEANNVLGEVIDVWIFGSSPSSVRLQANLNFITGSYMLESPSGFSNENIRSTNISGNVYLVEITAESTVESLLRRNDFTAYNDTGSFTISNPQVNRGIERKQYLETTTGLDTPMITYVDGRPAIGSFNEITYLLVESDTLLNAPWDYSSNGGITLDGSFIGFNRWRIDNTNTAGIAGTGFSSLENTASYALTAGKTYTLSFVLEFGTSPAFGVILRADTASGVDVTVNSDLTFSGLVDDGSYSNLVGRFKEKATGVYIVEISFTAVNTENYQLPVKTGNCIIGNIGSAIANTTSFVGNFAFTESNGSIPREITEGATKTRFRDIIKKTGVSSLIGQTEGTIFFEFEVPSLDIPNSVFIFDIYENPSTDRISLAQLNSGTGSFQFIMEMDNNFIILETVTINTKNIKLAISYNSNKFIASVNGSTVVNENITFGGYTNFLQKINIGSKGNTTSFSNSLYYSAFIKKTFTSESELNQITV